MARGNGWRKKPTFYNHNGENRMNIDKVISELWGYVYNKNYVNG